MAEAPLRVVATAGHVDHGKSTLIRALTGQDPDRLAEERARGMTIDLGFAWCTLASGRELAFVDVPGHVRFIKNMLAGVGAVDACLFVVAADDGWMPQSEEHLRILELLGIGRGIVALTKVATVPAARRAEVRAQVRARLRGTFLAEAALVEVDAPAGEGVGALAGALDDLAAGPSPVVDRARPRLWVDRVFVARGAGSVVTGTLTGGGVAVGDDLLVVPGPPPEHRPFRVRVRALQSHRRALSGAPPGGRVALNLAGVARPELRRGQALVRAGQFEPARTFDATLAVLGALGHDVGRRGAFQIHVGAAQYSVGVRLLDTARLAPGEEGLARLHLPVALPLLPGDRYVLREAGRAETVGGGEILVVDPQTPAATARPAPGARYVVAERGFVDASLLERLTGEALPPDVGRWVVDPAARAAAESALATRVASAGARGLELAVLDERERALLGGLAGVVVAAGRALASEHAGGGSEGLGVDGFLAALAAAPFTPPAPAEHGVDPATLRELARRRLVSGSQGVFFSADAVARAAETVAALLAGAPEGITVSEVREALGTTRKYALPLLALLDANGVTRRRGETRVAGPALQGSGGLAESAR